MRLPHLENQFGSDNLDRTPYYNSNVHPPDFCFFTVSFIAVKRYNNNDRKRLVTDAVDDGIRLRTAE